MVVQSRQEIICALFTQAEIPEQLQATCMHNRAKQTPKKDLLENQLTSHSFFLIPDAKYWCDLGVTSATVDGRRWCHGR